MVMEIAALSMAMSSASTMQQVNVSMMKKSMENQEATSQNLIQMMSTPTAHTPAPGKLLDIYI